MDSPAIDTVKAAFDAFTHADRDAIERLLADDFEFSAPPDPLLDRAGFFERCWPGAGTVAAVDYVRMIEDGDEVVVTYERPQADGGRGRNTEIFTVRDGRIVREEVYFGWNIE